MEIHHTKNGLQQSKTHENNRNVESNVIESTNENTKMNDNVKHEQTKHAEPISNEHNQYEVNIKDMLNHKKRMNVYANIKYANAKIQLNEYIYTKERKSRRTFASDTIKILNNRMQYYRRVLNISNKQKDSVMIQKNKIINQRIKNKYERCLRIKKMLHRATSHLYDSSNITLQTLKKLENRQLLQFNI